MNVEIQQALQSARYNETVQVSVVDEDGATHEVALVAGLDEIHGGIQWNPIESSLHDEAPKEKILKRYLRTKKWMFPMLNDHYRNQVYHQAIDSACSEVIRKIQSQKELKEMHSLDIGSGTGLLAMMSAKYLQPLMEDAEIEMAVRVTSVEMSKAMATIAKETISANKFDDLVTVVEGHSCEIPDLSQKALLCTSELLESGLLAEGWIPAMRDAWARHLHPDAIVVPCAARVVAQVIEGEALASYWGPHNNFKGFPEGRFLDLTVDGGSTCLLTSTNSLHPGVQVPLHSEKLLADESLPVKTLSKPITVLQLRVDSKDAIPSVDGTTKTTTFVPTSSGRAHGVIFWWEIDLFGNAIYSTQPGHSPWQDHWQQCVFIFSKPSDECTLLEKDVPATIKCFQNDSSLAFEILCDDDLDNRSSKIPRSLGMNEFQISPFRCWQLNDQDRLNKFKDGIARVLDKKGPEAFVLDISDFSLCSMIAALLGSSNVVSLEASSSKLPEISARIAQISNSLPFKVAGKANKFEILNCHPEHVTKDVLGGSPDIIVGEPYYETLEGWSLLEALNFFYLSRGLRQRGVITNETEVLPSFASIKAMAFQSHDIGQAYQRCDREIHGFDHDTVNRYYDAFSHDIVIQAWQYSYVPLSSAIEIARMDYSTSSILGEGQSITIPITQAGTCHGVLIWVEYAVFQNSDGTYSLLDTSGRSYQQSIRLFPQPTAVATTDSLTCSIHLGKHATPNNDPYRIDIEFTEKTK